MSEFYKYFYKRASDFMGPADGDIYQIIEEEYFENTGNYPPNYTKCPKCKEYVKYLDEGEICEDCEEESQEDIF